MNLRFGPATLLGLAMLCFPFLARAEVTITFGGDMNFNASREYPSPRGTRKAGRSFAYADLFQGIHPFLDGALNFANLETVVSERADLPDSGGKFVFVSHPNGLQAAVDAGINLFGAANNHIGDHGIAGMEETLKNLEAAGAGGSVHFAGLGRSREEALTPSVFDLATPAGTYRIAFLALTNVSNTPAQAGGSRPGTLYLRDRADLADALARMAATRADYKILSIHGGTEGVVALDPNQQAFYEKILERGDIDLILGHHPHRVRPVERVGHKVIFYSLGNYLMLGASNLNGHSEQHDYGLLGKLHLDWDGRRNRLVAQAAEAIPLYDMQSAPRAFAPREAALRMQVLNRLGKSQLGEAALSFTPDSRGFGRACLGAEGGARARAICASLGN